MNRFLAFFRRRVDWEVSEELRSHIDERVDDLVEEGMSETEARVKARREFGNVMLTAERSREVRSWVLLEQFVQDTRYARRTLLKRPVFLAVAGVTLAVGIGANTAAFTLLNAVFLETLPVESPDQLHLFRWSSPTQTFPTGSIPYRIYLDMRERTAMFEDMLCQQGARGAIGEWGQAEIELVSGNYFQVLGIGTALGRSIGPQDDRVGEPAQVAVISYGLWQRSFAGSPEVIDRTIRIHGVPFQIVGVTDEGFAGTSPLSPRDVRLPLAAYPLIADQPLATCNVVGRRRPDISASEARAEAELLFQQGLLTVPTDEDPSLVELRFDDAGVLVSGLRERTSLPLMLLVSTVVVLLLIACANVAGLLLARTSARRRELAARLALGASRGRLLRQLLTESLLLSFLGGVAGIACAFAVTPLLPRLLSQLTENMSMGGAMLPVGIPIDVDARVLGFSLIAILLTGLVFGLAPALAASRVDLVSTMKVDSGLTDRSRFRTGKFLLSAQVALSLLLLLGAGLLVRTVANLTAVPVGYNPDNLLFFMVSRDDRESFVRDTILRLEAIPEVTSVAASIWPLFNNAEPKMPLCLPGMETSQAQVDLEFVTPRFFDAWGVPLLAGRDFRLGDEPSAIVNQEFADRFFADGPPLGRTIGLTAVTAREHYTRAFGECPGTPVIVIGVVEDHRDRQREALNPMVYLPYPSNVVTTPTTFALRTEGIADGVTPRAREILDNLGAIVDGDIASGISYRDRMLRRERLLRVLLVFLGTIALFLASIGIYGTMTFSVERRVREIGLRMALGAQRDKVIGMVIGEALIPIAIGLLAGVLSAALVLGWFVSFLFGVSPYDPYTFVTAILVFLAVSVFAAFVPVLRATRVDPMIALRHE